MRRSCMLGLGALVATVGVLAAGCGGGGGGGAGTGPAGTGAPAATAATAPTGTAAEPVACTASIGLVAPITGPAAAIGTEQLNWTRLAVDRFNDENGTSIALVEGDTQLDPSQASTVATQFASNDKIVAVVGPSTSQGVDAAGEILARAGMPAVSMSATKTDLTDGRYSTFFRVNPTDADQGPTDARFIAVQLGAKKVFVVDDQSSYSTALADQTQKLLEQAGVSVERESVRQNQSDFSALVSKVSGATDVVFLPWQVAANAQLFADQLEEQGKNATIFGADALFSPKDFKAAGSYISTFAPDITSLDDPAIRELVNAYTSRYGDFGTFGPPTYAAADVILNAILRVCRAGAEPTRKAVLEQVKQTDLPASILGQPIRFTKAGDIENARFFIFQVQDDGTYKLVG